VCVCVVGLSRSSKKVSAAAVTVGVPTPSSPAGTPHGYSVRKRGVPALIPVLVVKRMLVVGARKVRCRCHVPVRPPDLNASASGMLPPARGRGVIREYEEDAYVGRRGLLMPHRGQAVQPSNCR